MPGMKNGPQFGIAFNPPPTPCAPLVLLRDRSERLADVLRGIWW